MVKWNSHDKMIFIPIGFLNHGNFIRFFNLTVHNFRTKLHHFSNEHQRYGTHQ